MLELNPARGRKGFIAKLSGMYEVRGTSEDAFLLLSGGACSSSIANFTISKHWNTQSIFVTVSERHRNSSITHDHNLSTTMRSIEACVILQLRCCIEVKVQIREIWQVQAIPCMWIISKGARRSGRRIKYIQPQTHVYMFNVSSMIPAGIHQLRRMRQARLDAWVEGSWYNFRKKMKVV